MTESYSLPTLRDLSEVSTNIKMNHNFTIIKEKEINHYLYFLHNGQISIMRNDI